MVMDKYDVKDKNNICKGLETHPRESLFQLLKQQQGMKSSWMPQQEPVVLLCESPSEAGTCNFHMQNVQFQCSEK